MTITLKTVSLDDMFSWWIGIPFEYPTEPFFLDVGMWDITETVVLAVNNIPENCVGLSIRHDVGRKTREAVRELAKEKNIFIEWVDKSEHCI